MPHQRKRRLFKRKRRRKEMSPSFHRLPIHERIKLLVGKRVRYHKIHPFEGYILVHGFRFAAKPMEGYEVADGAVVKIVRAHMFYAMVVPLVEEADVWHL